MTKCTNANYVGGRRVGLGIGSPCNPWKGRDCQAPGVCQHMNRTTGDGYCREPERDDDPGHSVGSARGIGSPCNQRKGRDCQAPGVCLKTNRTTGEGVCRDPLERELERTLKPKLVEMARERGLSTTGTKIDIIRRIVASKQIGANSGGAGRRSPLCGKRLD
jgi:hypothetical protein